MKSTLCSNTPMVASTFCVDDFTLWPVWSEIGLARLSFQCPSEEPAIRDREMQWLKPNELSSSQYELLRQIEALLRGQPVGFEDVELDLQWCSPFQLRVLACCREIGWGATSSYRELACAVGAPRAARAVGNVMRTNRFPLVVPCHRVVRSDGKLGGFTAPGGISFKRYLLELESSTAQKLVPEAC